MHSSDAKWKVFEKTVLDIHHCFKDPQTKIRYDDRIFGEESKRKRQIDISVRSVIQGSPFLMIIECKDLGRPVDVNELGAFASLAKDVLANKAVIVSKSGFTKSALEYARSCGIDAQIYGALAGQTVMSIPAMSMNQSVAWRAICRSLPPGLAMADVVEPSCRMTTADGRVLEPLRVLAEALVAGEPSKDGESFHQIGVNLVVQVRGHNLTLEDLIVGIRRSSKYFFGPIAIEREGLLDASSGNAVFGRIRTELIDLARMRQGLLPGWIEIAGPGSLAIEPLFTYTTRN